MKGMFPKTGTMIALIAASALILVSDGCRSRARQSGARSVSASSKDAENDRKVDAKVAEAKAVAIRDDEFDLPFAKETHETYQMAPGARVEIGRFNGKIAIETTTADTADIYVVRSVRNPEDLRNRKLMLKHTPEELSLRMEREGRSALFSIFSERGPEKQRLVLKLPRKIDLSIEGMNGRVSIGEIDGAVSITGISGRVDVAQATGSAAIAHVNGKVFLTVAKLGPKGITVEGVNGGVELLFAGNVSANLSVEGVNGRVDPDLPNVVFVGERHRNNFRAQIGKGGPPIEIHGVNGNVRLAPIGARAVAAEAASTSK
jgi:hypothetical protein